MNVNARAPFILMRQLLDMLEVPERACIINIASVVAIKGYPLQSAYSASKHALRGMTIALSNELRDSSIDVRLLCPGGVETGMVTNVRPDIDKQDLINPEEIAELVLYLATHKGNAVMDELRIRRRASDPWYSG
jgi:short-subunit dehydrogenase